MKKGIWKKIVLLSMALILITGLVFVSYFSVCYKSQSDPAISAQVSLAEEIDHIALIPETYEAALIFYSGAKVEESAYIPLFEICAKEGVLCLIIRTPFHFPLFDIGAASSLKAAHPEVEHWYLAGHSLGGVCASLYLKDHPQEAEGLILLASYAYADLSDTGLRVLDIYGDLDGVMNKEKHDEHLKDLPADYEALIIEGGNHCQFGDYGLQKGDNEATISSEEQKQITARAILSFIRE